MDWKFKANVVFLFYFGFFIQMLFAFCERWVFARVYSSLNDNSQMISQACRHLQAQLYPEDFWVLHNSIQDLVIQVEHHKNSNANVFQWSLPDKIGYVTFNIQTIGLMSYRCLVVVVETKLYTLCHVRLPLAECFYTQNTPGIYTFVPKTANVVYKPSC